MTRSILIPALASLLISGCSTISGQTRLAPPACDWPEALALPDRDESFYTPAPLIERPVGDINYTQLGALIKAGNAETRLYNATVPVNARAAREADETAVTDHNDATNALEAECARRLTEWIAE